MPRARTVMLHVAAAILLIGASSAAQSFRALAHFSPQEGEPLAGLIRASDGAYYGTTRYGGAYGQGSVFRLTIHRKTVAFTTVHAFKGPDGSQPWAPLVQASDGFLYGTTSLGGLSDNGTVFRIDRRGRFRMLCSFDGPTTGDYPVAGLLQATDGLLYGTTFRGGAAGSGTLFRLDTAGAITVLHAFDYWSTGASSQGPLIQARDGLLYGTTSGGGTFGQGVFFSIDTGGSLRVLHSFNAETTGSLPDSGVIQARDGFFYGTTFNGGTYGAGTLFRADSRGAVNVLRSFDPATIGGHPTTPLIEGHDGSLYGTTISGGGQGVGTAYRFDATNGAVVVFHMFESSSTGRGRKGALLEVSGGDFFGMASQGGKFGPGTIFHISVRGESGVLHDFKPGVGWLTLAALVQASNGEFYGVTRQRGGYDLGAIFRIDRSGALRRLYSFDGSVGALPSAALLEAPDGSLYSTAENGGASGSGSVFSLSPTGRVELLHSFADGADPKAPLIRGSDGFFYGTTCNGGASGYGTVFRMDDTGAATVLQSFDIDATGGCPMAALVEGDDRAFYGTTSEGGPIGTGTIFRVDTSGQLTVLHAFDPARTGTMSISALIKGADGFYYGTAYAGGAHNFGTVFRMDRLGAVRVLHAFDGTTTGGYPAGPLVQARDGFLYGTTSAGFWGISEAGPAKGFGNVFRIDVRGKITVLHTFDRTDGTNPVAGLIQADDGRLYGTTPLGGVFGGGVAFRLSVLAVTVVSPNGGESLFPGKTTTISWTAAGAPTTFDVELSRDGGATFTSLRSCMSLPGSVRTCAWKPTGPPTREAIVRVTAYDANGDQATGESNARFAIGRPHR